MSLNSEGGLLKMKTRAGFVSNSSSSSFVILGFNSDNIHVDFSKVFATELETYRQSILSTRKNIDECVEDRLQDLIYDNSAADGKFVGRRLYQLSYSLDELREMAQHIAYKYGVRIDDIRLLIGTEWN